MCPSVSGVIEMSTPTEIENVIRAAFGFGDFEARYWFIGLEPGLSGTEPGERKRLIANRIAAWKEKEIEDLFDYHKRIDVVQWFGPEAKLQRTWAKLIRVLMVLNAKPVNTESLKRFQSDVWGRANSETCLLELFPLPCPSTKKKDWEDCYKIERADYEERCRRRRIPRFQALIREYRPRAIIFYGVTKMKEWKLIAGVDFDSPNRDLFVQVKNRTLFSVIKHPSTKGITNMYFKKVGREIRSYLTKMEGEASS